MEENNENLTRNSQEIERDENGRLKKGVVLNPLGRPKGSEDFKTKWFKFVDKVAKSNNMTPEEIDEQLFAIGFKKAKEGDYAFYRDIHDRVYGKPIQHTELTGKDGKDLIPDPLSEEEKEKLNLLLNDKGSLS